MIFSRSLSYALAFFALCIGTTFSVCGKAKKTTEKSSLLWKVEGRGLAQPSYIFGTMHIMCPDDYLWTPAMQKAFGETKQLVMEMDLSDPTLQMKMAAAMMKNKVALNSYYSEQEYTEIKAFMDSVLHLPSMVYSRLSPVFASTLLATKIGNCADYESYEMNLMKAAKKDTINIVGLETVEDQLAVMSKINNDSAAKELLKNVRDFDSYKAEMSKLTDAYRTQDLNKIDKIANESEGMDDMGSFLLKDRNDNWLKLLPALFGKKSSFVAVGAAHLAGKDGLVAALKKIGYKLTPIQ